MWESHMSSLMERWDFKAKWKQKQTGLNNFSRTLPTLDYGICRSPFASLSACSRSYHCPVWTYLFLAWRDPDKIMKDNPWKIPSRDFPVMNIVQIIWLRRNLSGIWGGESMWCHHHQNNLYAIFHFRKKYHGGSQTNKSQQQNNKDKNKDKNATTHN